MPAKMYKGSTRTLYLSGNGAPSGNVRRSGSIRLTSERIKHTPLNTSTGFFILGKTKYRARERMRLITIENVITENILIRSGASMKSSFTEKKYQIRFTTASKNPVCNPALMKPLKECSIFLCCILNMFNLLIYPAGRSVPALPVLLSFSAHSPFSGYPYLSFSKAEGLCLI